MSNSKCKIYCKLKKQVFGGATRKGSNGPQSSDRLTWTSLANIISLLVGWGHWVGNPRNHQELRAFGEEGLWQLTNQVGTFSSQSSSRSVGL